MSHSSEPPFHSLQFYVTAPYPCSYLADQQARSQVVVPSHLVNTPQYSALIQCGFRRSGLFVYRPVCDACQACQALRVAVQEFTPDRSQRRARKKHQSLQARIMHPRFVEEHYQLYQRYQRHRHNGGDMAGDGRKEYAGFILQSGVHTQLVEFRTPGDGVLKMVSIVDVLPGALSSVYTFYEPADPGCSYGTWGILWQIDLARRLDMRHLYLGYQIEECRKMNYKKNWRPNEVLVNGHWNPQMPAAGHQA